jgi:hypothetical protein
VVAFSILVISPLDSNSRVSGFRWLISSGIDADEQTGQPIVSNGLPLTKFHHAAFDALANR